MRKIDEYGMMKEDYADEGDDLWRTAIAFIAYLLNRDLYDGIKLCAYLDSDGMILRHPTTTRRDTSRDAVVMMTVALLLNCCPLIKLKYRISDAHTMRDSWLWWIAVSKRDIRGRMCGWIFKLISLFAVPFQPAYSQHIWSWMIYTLPGWHPVMHVMGLLIAGERNLLLRLLHGGCVSTEEIDAYIPKNDFYWQRDGTENVIIYDTPNEPYPIDKDILYTIKKRNEIETHPIRIDCSGSTLLWN